MTDLIWHDICNSKRYAKCHKKQRKFCQNLLTEKCGIFLLTFKFSVVECRYKRREKERELQMRKFRSSSFRSIRSRYSRGYNAPGSYVSYGSDDGYDAAKDAYLTGEGPAVTASQRREEEMLREEDRRYRYEMGR